MSSPESINPERFQKCRNIAEFYNEMGVPSFEVKGPLGGRKYSWYVTSGRESFEVSCSCNSFTLGGGFLGIESRMASSEGKDYFFRGTPVVDRISGRLSMNSILGLGNKCEMQLPFTKK